MAMAKRRNKRDRDRAIDEAVALEEYRAMTRPPTTIEIVRRLTKPNALDPRLLTTDRHMQRWAIGEGTGLPDPGRALYRPSRLTPLAPEIAIQTNRVVLDSPPFWRNFIGLWYHSDCSVEQLAADLGMSRDKVFLERRIVLAYLLGRLTSVGIRLSTWEPTP